jgi:hypothetical protein
MMAFLRSLWRRFFRFGEIEDALEAAVTYAASVEELDGLYHRDAADLAITLDDLEEVLIYADDVEQLDAEYFRLKWAHERLERELGHEQLQRVSAQNGLTPYVYALQAFNEWLGQQPEIAGRVEEVMRSLGIWGIEVGYDPKKDVATSIISPTGPAARQGMQVIPVREWLKRNQS